MFKSAAGFSLHVEELARKHKISHMDAVLKYCEENYLDPDDIKSLINKTLKDKIEMNMRELNMLPKKAELDLE
jgi:hypothetical protein